MTSSVFQRFTIFRLLLSIGIIAILVLTFFAKQYAFFPFDLYLTTQIQRIDVIWFSNLMIGLTWLGNETQAIISLTIGVLLFWIYNKKDYAMGLLISTTGAVSISETIKFIVARPRPDPNIINQIETFAKADSFPSGHVLLYIGFYGFLLFSAFTLIKEPVLRYLVCGVLGLMVGLIGMSRIYIGSHWFSDTLASYLIGSIWLYFMVLLFRKIEVLFKKNG